MLFQRRGTRVVVLVFVVVVVVIVGVIRAHGVADAIFGRHRRREVVLPIAARCFAIHVNIVAHLAGGGLMSDLHPLCLVIFYGTLSTVGFAKKKDIVRF